MQLTPLADIEMEEKAEKKDAMLFIEAEGPISMSEFIKEEEHTRRRIPIVGTIGRWIGRIFGAISRNINAFKELVRETNKQVVEERRLAREKREQFKLITIVDVVSETTPAVEPLVTENIATMQTMHVETEIETPIIVADIAETAKQAQPAKKSVKRAKKAQSEAMPEPVAVPEKLVIYTKDDEGTIILNQTPEVTARIDELIENGREIPRDAKTKKLAKELGYIVTGLESLQQQKMLSKQSLKLAIKLAHATALQTKTIEKILESIEAALAQD